MIYTLRITLFRERISLTKREKRALTSTPSCISGWARRIRLSRRRRSRRSGAALAGVICDGQLCRPRHRNRGRSRFLNVDLAEWSTSLGEGRLHHGSSARPSPTGGERLCGEGRGPHHRVLQRHHARRGTATAPSAGHGAPPGIAPEHEIGIRWQAWWILFYHRHQC